MGKYLRLARDHHEAESWGDIQKKEECILGLTKAEKKEEKAVAWERVWKYTPWLLEEERGVNEI